MRIRLWVPLPGPFAITSGHRQPRTTEKMQGGRRGLFWWPTVPVRPSALMSAVWCLVIIFAVLWNVSVLLTLTVVTPVRAIRARRAARRTAAGEHREEVSA